LILFNLLLFFYDYRFFFFDNRFFFYDYGFLFYNRLLFYNMLFFYNRFWFRNWILNNHRIFFNDCIFRLFYDSLLNDGLNNFRLLRLFRFKDNWLLYIDLHWLGLG